ncbi:MAG: DUF4446 family protein [Armatimonadota bacterium]|nr:DUF4446 family protein [Armatimonadota bacterium]MDR5696755.1 DUF4446 family protein [Armatimonadota bacterium]
MHEALSYVLAASLAVLAACTIVLARRTGRLQRALQAAGAQPAAEHLATHQAALEALRTDVERMRTAVQDLAGQLAGSVQRVGVVRFDAFEDIGGRISFSLALLDARGNGVVLSVLNGRETARAYAKAVRNGTSSHPLSEEEKQAIAAAMRIDG